MSKPGWTDERKALLKELWTKKGLTATQCAARLGGVTRNAVLSKVHRMGISERSKGRPGFYAAERQRKTYTRKRKVVEAVAPAKKKFWTEPTAGPYAGEPTDPGYINTLNEVAAAVPVERRVALDDLAHDGCRYPLGDPREPGFGFCPDKAFPGVPYCAAHAKRCYQPPALNAKQPKSQPITRVRVFEEA